ncbi:hypothetical protein MASR2M66_05200 [Chloroflexota bacterium]
MLRRSYKILIFTAALILMLACVPTLGSAPAPVPTFDSNAPLTAIAGTANVAATQTAVNLPPTATVTLPTKTPFPTPTATVTFIYILPTKDVPPTQVPLGSSSKKYECQILAVEPKRALAPNEGFTAKWTVANIGKSTWEENNFDYRYLAGDKLHLQPAFDFPVSVAPGVVVELTVAMMAPPNPGDYVTTWKLNAGKLAFCEMVLEITVQ